MIIFAGLSLFAAACILGVLLAAAAHRRMRASAAHAVPAVNGYQQYLDDKRQLNAEGYAQQLRRHRSGFSSFALSFATLSVISGAVLYYGPIYELAGPWAFGIGLPAVAICAILTSAVTAELASAVPAAGGVYQWARKLGGRRWGRYTLLLRTFSDLCLLLLLGGAAAVMLDAAVSRWIGYPPGVWSLLLWMLALLAVQTLLAVRSLRGSSLALSGGAWLQVALVAAIVTGLIFLFEPGLQPAAYLFSAGTHGNGDYSWLQLAAALILLQRLFIGSDSASSATEEIQSPSVNVPWGMYSSTVYGFVFAYVLCVFVTLSIMDIAGISGSGNLFLALIANLWGWLSPVIAPLIYVGAVLCLWLSGLGVLTSASRQWFAYLRDGSSAWSRWLQHIDSRRQTPQRLLILLAAAAAAMMFALALWRPWEAAATSRLIYVSAMSSVAFNLSLAIPIGLRLSRHRRVIHGSRKAPAASGPPRWQLGRLSRPLQAVALLWLLGSAAGAALLLAPLAGLHALLAVLTLLLVWPLRRLIDRRVRLVQPASHQELLAQERSYRQL
ncbi:APC family permease [Paenibacillus sp. 1P07SE]|uniref:APC family permease n=1 Tax=Paenibacillus sp. 1P07SE TaxID=3132209 RepID=UPI0039A43624